MTKDELIVHNRSSLLVYGERHGISNACRVFGVSRTLFYKLKKQLVTTGSLAPRLRRKPKMPNETSLSKKKNLLRLVLDHPSWGPLGYARAFAQQGISVTPSCLWRHLKRYDLHTRYKRLVYLEQLRLHKQPLTERTIKSVRQYCTKQFKGLWPGHIVGIDTFYVGNLKGVGRIYQVTGIDLCSRYGWAQLYQRKDQDASMHFIEQILLPKLYANNVQLESVLSDNGSEFIGSKFEQMLAQYDIRHHRIPPGKPIFNGCCERFQRTILEEFYQRVFRIKFFNSMQELQKALDEFLVYYNFQRPHFGLSKKGLIPVHVLKTKQSIIRQQFQKLLP
jgi:transposase InsO family protein